MTATVHNVPICIIDRADGRGAETAALDRLCAQLDVQRILPHQLGEIRPETRAIYVRAAYFGDLEEPLRQLSELSWIHVAIAGTEHLPTELFRERGVALTNSAGVLDDAIGDFVVASVLMWSKGLLQSVRDTEEEVLNHREPIGNDELRVLIVGAGGIGGATARAFRQLGVPHIAGVRRDPAALDSVFDEHVPTVDLAKRVGDFNVVIASLPATAATANLISREVLESFGHPGVFVNVGRGTSVDHAALVDMLRAAPESAAVLDVTEPEPLPSGHPLWRLPNSVISPHMAGDTLSRHERYALLFEANLERFSRGEALLNQVV